MLLSACACICACVASRLRVVVYCRLRAAAATCPRLHGQVQHAALAATHAPAAAQFLNVFLHHHTFCCLPTACAGTAARPARRCTVSNAMPLSAQTARRAASVKCKCLWKGAFVQHKSRACWKRTAADVTCYGCRSSLVMLTHLRNGYTSQLCIEVCVCFYRSPDPSKFVLLHLPALKYVCIYVRAARAVLTTHNDIDASQRSHPPGGAELQDNETQL
jgi:hypothetical protein